MDHLPLTQPAHTCRAPIFKQNLCNKTCSSNQAGYKLLLHLLVARQTLGDNCALAANQSVDYRATILFTISLDSAKMWNRGFNWPVFGVRMHKKSPNVCLCGLRTIFRSIFLAVGGDSVHVWLMHLSLSLSFQFQFQGRTQFVCTKLCFFIQFQEKTQFMCTKLCFISFSFGEEHSLCVPNCVLSVSVLGKNTVCVY